MHSRQVLHPLINSGGPGMYIKRPPTTIFCTHTIKVLMTWVRQQALEIQFSTLLSYIQICTKPTLRSNTCTQSWNQIERNGLGSSSRAAQSRSETETKVQPPIRPTCYRVEG